ncbi:hypothetical protein [Allorhodopirellula solitaria]|nr:hypothetical protein [Allorhodopirellula solitaria]
MASMFAWASFDLRFESMVQSLGTALTSPLTSLQATVATVGLARTAVFSGFLFVALLTLGLLIAERFRSTRASHSRSLRSLMAIVSVVAIWCSLSVNYSALAWQGNRIRMATQLDELEAITEPLRQDWPQRDGEVAQIGPFMAYPFGRPSVLVLLASPTLANDHLSIAAIERNHQGAIKLQLNGTDHDDWAEWHPAGSQPESFVGGLSDPHELESSARLGQGWSLVRYRSE